MAMHSYLCRRRAAWAAQVAEHSRRTAVVSGEKLLGQSSEHHLKHHLQGHLDKASRAFGGGQSPGESYELSQPQRILEKIPLLKNLCSLASNGNQNIGSSAASSSFRRQ
mmetsp:Transcript_89481/g.186947  ORF Transcript_89481/g.186947 Transcript_89481/m.186947 type:complete len:109 (+) Transcript_89481:197-523(+)|eukprot:CAMPEP_0206461434 /NCGR_PEP_ID=MMETSP0324_2-20121206/25361_1 /ASSEMBLY_ACC=CAM_ASM_000836 /TAXON_ID=2866 /ORGANISM="Crypthecodinium cohnii, Strain Seligo" /LENGTH=108 /DNA_ID=CAMNT_0053933359 /DNA_START=112 /DNA_END=438 /DNA_ORIENTATION=-